MSPQLRASLFSSVREVHELNLQVLMLLHAERPGEGFGAAALLASEKGRARSLLELLAESGTEIRRGVDVALVNRELELERLISGQAEQQTRLLNAKHTDAGRCDYATDFTSALKTVCSGKGELHSDKFLDSDSLKWGAEDLLCGRNAMTKS
jgi:hypothetical protein